MSNIYCHKITNNLFQFHDIQLLGILLASYCRKKFSCVYAGHLSYSSNNKEYRTRHDFRSLSQYQAHSFIFSTSHYENQLRYQHSFNCFQAFAESIVVSKFNIHFRSFDCCADDVLMISCRLINLQILIMSLSLLENLNAIIFSSNC